MMERIVNTGHRIYLQNIQERLPPYCLPKYPSQLHNPYESTDYQRVMCEHAFFTKKESSFTTAVRFHNSKTTKTIEIQSHSPQCIRCEEREEGCEDRIGPSSHLTC